MALKSETLLQAPPIVLGSASMKINDDKLSNDEDLEDGEIFDDDENESEATAVASSNTGSQKSVVGSNSTTGAVQNNSISSDNVSDNKNKDNAVPDSTTTFSKTATLAAADSSSGNNVKSESQSGYVPPWKTSNANILSGSDNAVKKNNSFHEEDSHKRSNREKKKKRKRLKTGDDDKHIKEKRAKRSSDKDGLGDSNHNDPTGDNMQPPQEDEDMEDDDDEMLFIRGASPTMHHFNKRHHRGSRDEDDNRLQDDEDDDFLDEDDNDPDDEDDEENGERRRRSNDLPGGLDRAARRERLLARGKRRGRGGANRDGNSKRRKDDSEICIFYLQGKCHKGGECPFSHDAMPHKKMELCKFYLMDCCNKKDKCLYMHSEFPCKYFHMGLKCYANKNCKFSHAKLSDAMRQVFIKTFGPVNSRGNKDFPSKKGASSKHRQDGDFPRGGAGRDGGRRGSECGNKRNGPGNNSGGPEKKIPSLFDIKVSIPTEMRNNNDNNNHSDSDGNHTPMPSPTHMQQMSDSSRSPPPLAMSRRRRKKERKGEKSKKSDGHRGDKNEGINNNNNNKRIPLMLMNNDTNWDEMMLEHQRMQQQMLAELAAGNFAEDSDHNEDDDNRHCNNNDQFFGSQHDNFNSNSNNSNSSNSNNKINNPNEDGGFNDTLMSSHRSPSPQNDSDTGGGLQIATQSNDSSNEMFPAHLPKKQRELFLRIKQQQRQASDSGNNGGGRLQIAEEGFDESSENNGNPASDKNDSSITLNTDDKNKMDDDDYDNKSKQHDENWYSSDEEDEQQPSSGTSSLNAILQNLVRLNSSNTGNLSPSTLTNSQTNVNSIFSSIQPAPVTSSIAESSVSSSTSSGGGGVNSISASGITNVDFDINEVSALLSKVKEHFQSNEKKTVRDPRLSRSDVGPNGDSPSSMTNTVTSTVLTNFPALNLNQNAMPSPTLGNEDVDLRLNSGNRSAGAGDMDLRNLPFKPAPVHSAATEIDASINSHSPLPYRLIPVIVAKPDYSSIQPNSKVGAADPRLRKSLRVSEESSSVVSSRDPRHRLIDNISKEKTTAPPVQNSDPRQRARAAPPAGIPNMIPTTMAEELQLPPSLMLSQLRSAFPMMSGGPGADMGGMMCPPTPRSDDEPPPNFMAPMPTRPSDPRQRPMQINLPPTGQIPQTLFDAINAMQNIRQPNFLSQTGDPRTRPPGVPNMPNVVFPGTVRSNDPVIRGQFNFK